MAHTVLRITMVRSAAPHRPTVPTMGSSTATSGICTTCSKPAFPHPYRHPITLRASAETIEKIRPVPMAPDPREVFEAGYLACERTYAPHDVGMHLSDQEERDRAYTQWRSSALRDGA
ncbi:hypothetical protein B7C42_08202 [Nocardia cerradoensis]|uniref:Uncharacterized protein n=1 Tax=Nocardia cerradoensis TaxID=85688 RepID=A0A231GSX3_9NOCA|nr:hypothetical protein B7C42_08202 [Nocardia cerradoensis]